MKREHSRHRLPVLETFDLGRPRLRMKNPIMAGYLEGITQSLYDVYRVAVATAAPKLILFSIPQGQNYNFGGIAAFAKSALHTNLVMAGVLEAPNKHIVRAISCFVQNNIASGDLQALLAQVFFQFFVNRKSYQDAQIGRLPAGGGGFFSAVGTLTAPAAVGLNVNGWPDVRNTYALAYGGVPIEQQQNFSVVIDPTLESTGAFTTQAAAQAATTPFVGTGINMLVHLDGTLFRAVQ